MEQISSFVSYQLLFRGGYTRPAATVHVCTGSVGAHRWISKYDSVEVAVGVNRIAWNSSC